VTLGSGAPPLGTEKAMLSKAVVCSVFVSLASLSAAPQSAAQSAGKAKLVAAAELKWVDVPDTPAKLATVAGDAAKGAHTSFFKLPGGFSAPLHSHTADHHVAVVAGTLTLTPEGEAAKKLGPGSWFEFTGRKKHVTACDAGADCLLFIVGKAAWDLVPAEAPKK
jgi:quercetin dioxygenase-like cupin family protein